eukprot:scaffold48997_cov21-Tisochrysis_lutea.AAC.5
MKRGHRHALDGPYTSSATRVFAKPRVHRIPLGAVLGWEPLPLSGYMPQCFCPAALVDGYSHVTLPHLVVEAAKASGGTGRFSIFVSLLEIYLEQVRDLGRGVQSSL